jgi:hypothetical protein
MVVKMVVEHIAELNEEFDEASGDQIDAASTEPNRSANLGSPIMAVP